MHRELYAEHGELYGENIVPKIERCLAVPDAEAAAAASAARGRTATRCSQALEPFDLLLTPTLAFVAPPADVDEIAIRERSIRFTFPFNAARLAGARAAVRPGRGRPAGVDPARRRARATTRSCSRAGLALEAALATVGPWSPTSASRTSSPTRPTRSRWRASARSTCASRRSPT